ncbi:MAG: aconitate hydratase AcnA [Dehalococcoidia bacterium]|nr:aconitate hydratase AcnA [Dehalococcoidia bacterium]
MKDSFGTRQNLRTSDGEVVYYSIPELGAQGFPVDRLPYTVKILLENLLRHADSGIARQDDIQALANWDGQPTVSREFPFLPARVILQDFTGVPAIVDLAAMRSAMVRLGGDPSKVNPLIRADLVIDHSVQVDVFGTNLAFQRNVEYEYERNFERYALLRWGQTAFDNFRVVPPGTGIVHQVNLEFLASVVDTREHDGQTLAFPDTLVGTDSHTTMINGLGVLGWGVGGIEAEACMLGQPLYLLQPEVIGVRLDGALNAGATATDLVLTVTEMLRNYGVVGKFVEFGGPGLSSLPLADRATIANMSPEYGATSAIFPVDTETLTYLRQTNRPPGLVDLVERYARAQGMWHQSDSPDPVYSDLLELDLSSVEPSLAGPRRPQDRVALAEVGNKFRSAYWPDGIDSRQPVAKEVGRFEAEGGAEAPPMPPPGEELNFRRADVELDGKKAAVSDGSVAIAAITSCTNTSNPSVMVGAGLLAKKAVERGLTVPLFVKTSLAPGSAVVTDYLDKAGVTPALEALGFHTVGYGCTTCIGNSGPLQEPVSAVINANDLTVAAVLSGNRNFEGRIHPEVRASFLASPPLVVAYALAGNVNKDLTSEPLGLDRNGEPVYLREIWPTPEEVSKAVSEAVTPDLFASTYGRVFTGDERWQKLPVPTGNLYDWDESSTYIQEPPFFQEMTQEPAPLRDLNSARVLVFVGDSVTTDHISPAGAIPKSSPAGLYLVGKGVEQRDFNSLGARRGNHEVMMRATFGNIRLRNKLTPGKEGNWTRHLPDGEVSSIYEAAMRYQGDGVPTIVIAGKEYGSGSSRDWAAKGPMLLGIRAAIAESFERIHRSNLVGMGILPLQFLAGENAESLGLDGTESYDIAGVAGLRPGGHAEVVARTGDGSVKRFQAVVRIDSQTEVEYYRHGGVLNYVLRNLLKGNDTA